MPSYSQLKPRLTPQRVLAAILSCCVCWSQAAQAEQINKRKPLADKDITAAIEGEYFEDAAIPHDDVEISTQNGIVTLTGTVGSLLARDHAQKLAQTVRGVRSVVNRVAVKPQTAKSDEQLRKDIDAALAYDPATDSYEVAVSVKDKIATLNGTVQSFAERDLAERVARGVDGIRDVRNQLKLVYRQRADGEILSDVRARLRWDAYVDEDLITADVRGGKVTLSGVVGSDAERSRAYFDAWVVGAKEVDTSKLTVEPWLSSDGTRKPDVKVADQEIQHAVNAALLYDPRVLSFNVKADVQAGVVTLRGLVDNLKAKQAALQDARATTGVARVVDRIRVRSSGGQDEEIAKRIRSAMERDPYVERYELLVKVDNGVAYLNGTVDSYFEKMRADQVASRALGVQRVQNNLTVYDDRSPLVYEPRIYDHYPYDYAWYTSVPRRYRTDDQVLEDIRDELFWSPFVDADQVRVRVQQGVATLEGKVDSFSEMYSALSNAYEGGATTVVNNLKVD